VEEPAAATAAAPEAASEAPAPAFPSEPISVEPSFAGKATIAASEPVELRLSRPLNKPEEARIAVVLGTTDLSDLFTAQETVLRLDPKITPLPSGSQEMVVFLCSSDRKWAEIARFPIRVLGRFGFERATLQPKLDLNVNGQIAEEHFPEEPAPPRSTFQDFTVTAALNTDHLRRQFNVRSQVNLVGASNEQQALRFGQEGPEAPQVDLSNYLLAVQQGPVLASLGHVTVTGGNRHLLGSVASRGASLAVKLGQRLDLALSALNGTSVVGFENLLGLDNSDHRILAGTLGLELLKRAGGLRLETTLLDGRLLPQFSFNQGNVNDSEQNRALGLRLLASLPSQRVRLEAGFTPSQFTNPEDPFLSQGFDVVQVQEETRNARYVDLGLDLLQGLRLGASRTASVTVLLRHERVDPLFRSVRTQLSLGLNHSTNDSSDSVFGVQSETRTTTLNTGISLSFF
jgi:hypothetical protein